MPEGNPQAYIDQGMDPQKAQRMAQGGGQQNPIEQNRSAFNPTDLAAMKQQGTMGPDMTVRQLIEDVLKVPIDAPATTLVQALRKQSENASPMGKVQNMAGQGGGPQGGPPPQGGPSPAPPQGGQPAVGGLDNLIRQMGGQNA